MRLLFCVAAAVIGLSLGDSKPTELPPKIIPDYASARRNAFYVFNAVHSAGRQWGSSLNPNGFTLIPTIVTAGTVLYHGSDEKQMPNNLEWLAFEVEHAESFARLWQGKVLGSAASARGQFSNAKVAAGDQIPLRAAGGTATCDRDDTATEAYFHTYTATHDLKLLLVDGMSAADGDAGAMDMWYTLHLGTNSATWNDDGELVDGRGPGDGFKPPPETDACAIAADMGFAGYIRLEMGFEVIYCNFTDGGLTQTFVKRQVPLEDRLVEGSSRIYQWARAASQRFDGTGGGRVRLDFSSMISGFYFDIDILDPTARLAYILSTGKA